MTKKETAVLWSSIVAIVVCVVTLACVLYAYFDGADVGDGTKHVVVSPPKPSEDGEPNRGELQVRLIRERLETATLGKNGTILDGGDAVPTDFSDSTQNIFGIAPNTLIGPSCYFTAYMAISNRKSGTFEYWLEIKTLGEVNPLAEQLEWTVKLDGEEIVRRPLGEGYVVEPLATVSNGDTSRFSVRIAYPSTQDNNETQGMQLQFDMIVHARLV